MRKRLVWALIIFLSIYYLFSPIAVRAEDLLPGNVIPKLPKTANDPVLTHNKIYPFWGPICQRYTYSVVYSDKAGRSPEYVKIYFNGKMLDMKKENPGENDYKKGVKYIFQNVPDKYGSNFYYFEASNGLGKARASIIDSPDNGPVLFDSDFKNNEIVLIDPVAGKELWRYSTGVEWIGAVALSSDGKYLTAQSSNHVYFFDTANNKPLWIYESPTKGNIGGDVKGGVAISANGTKVFAAINGKAVFFDYKSNKPIWSYNTEQNGGNAYGVDISKDGSFAAVAMAGSESAENSNVLILFNKDGKKLWQYHSSGNWHEVNFSEDGLYLAGSTGCPDRRGYLFSRDSQEPVIKSEPLSKESPVDEARISASGGVVAYGVESSYGAVILMDKNTKKIIWKYETPYGRSVRALAMAPDGELIGAGTFGGEVLLFEKKSNIPIEQIKINSTIGAFDMSDDGSIFVTGSADKKIRIFHKGEGRAKAEIALNEYVGELDISANGKYAAAGTSGSVYFFESIIDLINVQANVCTKIIEPPKENTSLFGGQNGGGLQNNNTDVFLKTANKKTIWPGMLFGFGFFGSFLFLISYIFVLKLDLISKIKKNIFKKSVVITGLKTSITKNKLNKKIVVITGIIGSIFLVLTIISIINNKENKSFTPSGNSNTKEGESRVTGCGNGMCEPDTGETKENCSKDCASSE